MNGETTQASVISFEAPCPISILSKAHAIAPEIHNALYIETKTAALRFKCQKCGNSWGFINDHELVKEIIKRYKK